MAELRLGNLACYMNINQKTEFPVRNIVRSAVFGLLYVEMFLLAVWLLPFELGLVAIGLLILSLMVIGFTPTLRSTFERQLFDRVRMARYGVEYISGVFGESWLRPYNEFRVDCQKKPLTRRYLVKLRHRVLANLVVGKSMRATAAKQLVSELTAQTGLKALRRAQSTR